MNNGTTSVRPCVEADTQDSALNQSRRWDDLCSHIQFMAGLFRPYCVYNRHTGRCCPDRTTATLPRVEADARDSVLKPRQRTIASTTDKKKSTQDGYVPWKQDCALRHRYYYCNLNNSLYKTFIIIVNGVLLFVTWCPCSRFRSIVYQVTSQPYLWRHEPLFI